MSLGKVPLKMPATVTADSLAEHIGAALRRSCGESRYAITRLARRIGADPRAVENWWYSRCAPRSAEMVRLMAENAEVAAVVLDLARQVRGAEGQH